MWQAPLVVKPRHIRLGWGRGREGAVSPLMTSEGLGNKPVSIGSGGGGGEGKPPCRKRGTAARSAQRPPGGGRARAPPASPRPPPTAPPLGPAHNPAPCPAHLAALRRPPADARARGEEGRPSEGVAPGLLLPPAGSCRLLVGKGAFAARPELGGGVGRRCRVLQG